MALVVPATTTMNVATDLVKATTDSSTVAGAEGVVVESLIASEKDLLHTTLKTAPAGAAPQHVLLKTEDSTNKKKRPLSDADHDGQPNTDEAQTPSKKKQRTQTLGTDEKESRKKNVQFIPDPADESRVRTTTKVFEIDYDRADIWWTNEESQAHMERQTSLLQLYANTCADLVDSVLLVWVNCAEEVMDDGNFCMSQEQRALVAERVAQSPVRGFEKELATDLITEQRLKTLGGILELQQLCHLNNVTQEERVDALAAASIEFSKTATLFAKTLAQADEKGARDHCRTQEESSSSTSS